VDQASRWVRRGTAQPWEGRIGVAAGGRVESKADNPTRYVGTPGMGSLALDLADGLSIESNVRIAQLRRRGDRWRLVDDAHHVFDGYDAVVVALPAPQARELLEPAPALQATCARATLAPCWAVMASFVMRLPLDHDGIFFSAGPLRWAARDSSKPHRIGAEAWVLHASEAWSRDHLEDDPGDVASALLSAFFAETGAESHAPAYARGHRWRFATPDPPLEAADRVDPEQRIVLAGDWLRGARLEGAYLSGRDAAAALSGQP
jgi:renalase